MQKCQLDIEMIQSTKYLTCVDVVMITVLCAPMKQNISETKKATKSHIQFLTLLSHLRRMN